MDQGVLANFKKYYIRRTYRQALKTMKDDSNMTLSDFWKSFSIYMCIKHIDQGNHSQKFKKAKLTQKTGQNISKKRPKIEKLYKQHKAKNYCKVYTEKAKFY